MVVPARDEVNATGMGGWLLLLCLLLLIAHPVSLALSTVRWLPAFETRGVGLVVILVARVLVAGIGVAAGLVLLGVRPGAVGFATGSLALSALMDLVVYSSPYVPSNRMPGTTPLYAAASLLYYGAWIAYLARSRRVRDTFGPA